MLAGCRMLFLPLRNLGRVIKYEATDKALADMEEIYNYIAIQLQAPENAIG